MKYLLPVPQQPFLKPVIGLWNLIGILVFAAYLCIKYRPRTCWTDNTWAALVFAIARKTGLCECSIYNSGDWVNSPKQNFVSYVLNNIIWRGSDYIAAAFSDLVLSLTPNIAQARDQFWGKKVTKRICFGFPPPLLLSRHVDKKIVSNICFMGQVRKDSGLELILPLLPGLNQKYGVKLKIIGPQIAYRKEIERQINVLGLARFVEFFGWVDTKEIGKVTADCFCGINLITDSKSYSSYTLPGKLIHYLQNMLPVLVTEGNGPLTELIQKDKLGSVVDLTPERIVEAIEDLFKQQESYRENIKKYAEKYPGKKIKDYIEIASGKYDS